MILIPPALETSTLTSSLSVFYLSLLSLGFILTTLALLFFTKIRAFFIIFFSSFAFLLIIWLLGLTQENYINKLSFKYIQSFHDILLQETSKNVYIKQLSKQELHIFKDAGFKYIKGQKNHKDLSLISFAEARGFYLNGLKAIYPFKSSSGISLRLYDTSLQRYVDLYLKDVIKLSFLDKFNNYSNLLKSYYSFGASKFVDYIVIFICLILCLHYMQVLGIFNTMSNFITWLCLNNLIILSFLSFFTSILFFLGGEIYSFIICLIIFLPSFKMLGSRDYLPILIITLAYYISSFFPFSSAMSLIDIKNLELSSLYPSFIKVQIIAFLLCLPLIFALSFKEHRKNLKVSLKIANFKKPSNLKLNYIILLGTLCSILFNLMPFSLSLFTCFVLFYLANKDFKALPLIGHLKSIIFISCCIIALSFFYGVLYKTHILDFIASLFASLFEDKSLSFSSFIAGFFMGFIQDSSFYNLFLNYVDNINLSFRVFLTSLNIASFLSPLGFMFWILVGVMKYFSAFSEQISYHKIVVGYIFYSFFTLFAFSSLIGLISYFLYIYF